ncbi:hypothetical protein [Saccharopolyspora griseoalba]|uniref:DUF2637 domain-containing protein n=1 Tax=Saccharopolyspora griseoalba TaxID=1431848 RepID=A0ABW2LL22_9PSEU
MTDLQGSPDPADEERQLAKAGAMINLFVWLVASVVMVFSAFAGAELLADHGVPWGLGLAGGLAVDAALIVALIGDRQLHRYGQQTPWGAGLRWVTAAMSLVLNCGQSAERGDWVAAGLHAIFPVLLIVLTEASQGYQIAFSHAVSRAQAERRYQEISVLSIEEQPVPASGPRRVRPSGTGAAGEAARDRRTTTRSSRAKPPAKPTRPNGSAGGQWTQQQWSAAVELVARYQREHGRDPKLGEFHSELRMSRNAASPLRNAVLAAAAKHGQVEATTQNHGISTDSTTGGTEAHSSGTSSSDTAPADTAETVHAS